MTLRGADVSNHQDHPDSYRQTAWYRESDFIIVQAIPVPRGYAGYDYIDPETGMRGYTGEQLRAAKEDGKKVGVYVWLWDGLPDTRADILRRLATVPASVQ